MQSGNENGGRINFLPKCSKLDYRLDHKTRIQNCGNTPMRSDYHFKILNICLSETKFASKFASALSLDD